MVGISRDSVETQARFAAKEGLAIPLLSDPEAEVLKEFGMFGEKSMYGRKVVGVIRSTVVIGADGKVEKVFEKVKTAGHAAKVLEWCRNGP